MIAFSRVVPCDRAPRALARAVWRAGVHRGCKKDETMPAPYLHVDPMKIVAGYAGAHSGPTNDEWRRGFLAAVVAIRHAAVSHGLRDEIGEAFPRLRTAAVHL